MSRDSSASRDSRAKSESLTGPKAHTPDFGFLPLSARIGQALQNLRLPYTLAALLLLVAGIAHARAGGGEHYVGRDSGPDFSDGGGGDGGEALFELIFAALRLTIYYPEFMIPLWLIAGGFMVYRLSRASSSDASARKAARDRAYSQLTAQPDLSQRLAALKERDPEFSPETFVERSSSIFLQVQEGWFRRDFSPVRHLMSDGLHRRFRVLQALMAKEGRRDALADVQIHRSRILSLNRSEGFDLISVGIEASVRDTELAAGVGDEEARRAAERVQPTKFAEVWTFVRRPGAKTRKDLGSGIGNCPNCGAPVGKGATSSCEYCGVIVNSGQYDWVLSEITQPSEFGEQEQASHLLAPLRKRDPDAAFEILQDRALLLFWKWLEAWGLEDLNRLNKVATPDFVAGQKREFEAFQQKGQRVVFMFPAVGGSKVVGVIVNPAGFDRVLVEIRWSAAVVTEEEGRQGLAQPRFRQHVLSMQRKSGVHSGPEGMSTERCGQCRAPLGDSDQASCEYCGHDLSLAASEWQLLHLVPYEDYGTPNWEKLWEGSEGQGEGGDGSQGAASGNPEDALGNASVDGSDGALPSDEEPER